MSHSRREFLIRTAPVALILGLAFALPPAGAMAEDANTIVVEKFHFVPMTLEVAAGTKVTWVNKDPEPHTVVSADGKFRSSALDTGDTFAFEFKEPGTYKFFCTLHPQMQGAIVVTAKK